MNPSYVQNVQLAAVFQLGGFWIDEAGKWAAWEIISRDYLSYDFNNKQML